MWTSPGSEVDGARDCSFPGPGAWFTHEFPLGGPLHAGTVEGNCPTRIKAPGDETTPTCHDRMRYGSGIRPCSSDEPSGRALTTAAGPARPQPPDRTALLRPPNPRTAKGRDLPRGTQAGHRSERASASSGCPANPDILLSCYYMHIIPQDPRPVNELLPARREVGYVPLDGAHLPVRVLARMSGKPLKAQATAYRPCPPLSIRSLRGNMPAPGESHGRARPICGYTYP